MKKEDIAFIDRGSICRFALSFECDSGGFSFSRTTPPTLEDTYYALRIFRELGVSYSNKKTLRYVRGLALGGGLNMRNVYRLMYVLDCLRLYDLLDVWKKKLESMHYQGSFSGLYYGLLCKEIVGEPLMRPGGVSRPRMEAYVPDVARQAVFLKKSGARFDEKRFVCRLQDAQMPDGGFGFLKYSTSFMDTTYHALRGLWMLGSAPADLEGCRRFVLICKNREGFGRQVNSLPTLESTCHAVACLKMLEEMDKAGKDWAGLTFRRSS